MSERNRQVDVRFIEHDGWWSTSVLIDGEYRGSGTGPTFAGVYDIVSDTLFPQCDVGCMGLGSDHRCSPLIEDRVSE